MLNVGVASAYIAFIFGAFFLIFYASRYYASIIAALSQSSAKDSHDPRGAPVEGQRACGSTCSNQLPLVSIHLPFYNEKNVAVRTIESVLRLDYPLFEVIVIDDSTDETPQLIKEFQGSEKIREIENGKGLPPHALDARLKTIHRDDRRGFKGGALREALGHTDTKAEFILVFDADFIPPSDIIQQFLAHFSRRDCSAQGDNQTRGDERVVDAVDEWRRKMEVAAVQGYQVHDLNLYENWITRGVGAEYSGSYLVERRFQELVGTLKMIAGSVFMIRADVLSRLNWSESLTEDWELTLRLYLEGYKVAYSPLIRASGEIPSTLGRLSGQRQRWAKSHTYNAKKFFKKMLLSPKLNAREKLEFLYYAPYYLQSVLLLVGTLCWFVAEVAGTGVLRVTSYAGWALLLANLLSLPLMNLTGLYLEGRLRKNWAGIFSQFILTYMLAPVQAYSALRGLLGREEGVWVRTYKTGRVTEAEDKKETMGRALLRRIAHLFRF